jgi:Fe-S cluster biogenesis protein NfuA
MKNITLNHEAPENYMIYGNGAKAILRQASVSIPKNSSVETVEDVMLATDGIQFPWGDCQNPPENWDGWGLSGLNHYRWFVGNNGRIGGAYNVRMPNGYYRFHLLQDQGCSSPDSLHGNEGYIVVKDTSPVDKLIYRLMTKYVRDHVGVDGGRIQISPIINNVCYFSFGGRCSTCPNLDESKEQFTSHIVQEMYKKGSEISLQDYTPALIV